MIWNIVLGLYLISILGMAFIIGYTKYKNPFIRFKKWQLFWTVVLPILNTWAVLDTVRVNLWIVFERKRLERKRKSKNYKAPVHYGDQDINSVYPTLMKDVRHDRNIK